LLYVVRSRRRPAETVFPYTTLFRSNAGVFVFENETDRREFHGRWRMPLGRVVGPGDAALIFETANLLRVLTGEFQAHARAHAVGFRNHDYAEMPERAFHGLDLVRRLNPGAAGGLDPPHDIDGQACGGGEIGAADADQRPRRGDHTSADQRPVVCLHRSPRWLTLGAGRMPPIPAINDGRR